MEIAHLFSGNALGAVDSSGRVRLPSFILREVARQGGGGRLLFGVHESDPCLTGYGAGLQPRLEAELERRRLRDEGLGRPPADHHARARRLFGLVEETSLDEGGEITLPPLARRRGGIGDRILFIGAGSHFEIWDPAVALADGGEAVREVARYRLGDPAVETSQEEEKEG
ncbi:MAG: division/cell wall cluster transcriptional repressor MraZ [Allosphingosinicella sp.]